MNKLSFYYEVIWYNDADDPEHKSHGFLIAESYTEATTILDKWYDIMELKLHAIGDGPVIEIPSTIDDFDVVEWEEANGF
jgi:hypothetical protein